MRTRLQMGAEEAESSRHHMIRDMTDLAWWVGAGSPSIDDVQLAIQARYGRLLKTRPAVLSRPEVWRIRFLRSPGGWLTTGERLRPDPGERTPGGKLPRYLRLRVPITPAGTVPRSLAPRREDLKALVPGVWRGAARGKRRGVPTLDVDVEAPVYGIVVVPVSLDLAPLQAAFPIRKSHLAAGLRALSQQVPGAKSQQMATNWTKRRSRENETAAEA